MFKKIAAASVLGSIDGTGKFADYPAAPARSTYQEKAAEINIIEALQIVAKRYGISGRPSDYIFVAVRANSINVPNENGDAFAKEECLRFDALLGKRVYQTYQLKPHCINHNTDNLVRSARGFIVDAAYNSLNQNDEFVEVLVAVDKTKDPIYARGVANGTLNKFSMGCTCLQTRCSLCRHIARSEDEFCQHIAGGNKMGFWQEDRQGQWKRLLVSEREAATIKDAQRSFEWCEFVTYEELSNVHIPADPKAETREVLRGASRRRAQQLATYFCPKCQMGTQLTTGAQPVCSKCGGPVSKQGQMDTAMPPVPISSVPATQTPPMLTAASEYWCPSCEWGYTDEPGACPHCGAQLQQKVPAESTAIDRYQEDKEKEETKPMSAGEMGIRGVGMWMTLAEVEKANPKVALLMRESSLGKLSKAAFRVLSRKNGGADKDVATDSAKTPGEAKQPVTEGAETDKAQVAPTPPDSSLKDPEADTQDKREAPPTESSNDVTTDAETKPGGVDNALAGPQSDTQEKKQEPSGGVAEGGETNRAASMRRAQPLPPMGPSAPMPAKPPMPPVAPVAPPVAGPKMETRSPGPAPKGPDKAPAAPEEKKPEVKKPLPEDDEELKGLLLQMLKEMEEAIKSGKWKIPPEAEEEAKSEEKKETKPEKAPETKEEKPKSEKPEEKKETKPFESKGPEKSKEAPKKEEKTEKESSLTRVAKSPPGWEDTVKKMKKHKEIDNPWALAWFMHSKNYTPSGKSEKKEGQSRPQASPELTEAAKDLMEAAYDTSVVVIKDMDMLHPVGTEIDFTSQDERHSASADNIWSNWYIRGYSSEHQVGSDIWSIGWIVDKLRDGTLDSDAKDAILEAADAYEDALDTFENPDQDEDENENIPIGGMSEMADKKIALRDPEDLVKELLQEVRKTKGNDPEADKRLKDLEDRAERALTKDYEKLPSEKVSQLQGKLETLYRAKFDKKLAEIDAEVTKRLEAAKQAFLENFKVGLSIAARRMALNLEEHPVKVAMADALLLPMELSGGDHYPGMGNDLEVAAVLVEAGVGPSTEKFAEKLVTRALEISAMNEESLAHLQKDLANLEPAPVSVQAARAARPENELRTRAVEGSLEGFNPTASLEPSEAHMEPSDSGRFDRNAIRQAVGINFRAGKHLRQAGIYE